MPFQSGIGRKMVHWFGVEVRKVANWSHSWLCTPMGSQPVRLSVRSPAAYKRGPPPILRPFSVCSCSYAYTLPPSLLVLFSSKFHQVLFQCVPYSSSSLLRFHLLVAFTRRLEMSDFRKCNTLTLSFLVS